MLLLLLYYCYDYRKIGSSSRQTVSLPSVCFLFLNERIVLIFPSKLRDLIKTCMVMNLADTLNSVCLRKLSRICSSHSVPPFGIIMCPVTHLPDCAPSPWLAWLIFVTLCDISLVQTADSSTYSVELVGSFSCDTGHLLTYSMQISVLCHSWLLLFSHLLKTEYKQLIIVYTYVTILLLLLLLLLFKTYHSLFYCGHIGNPCVSECRVMEEVCRSSS